MKRTAPLAIAALALVLAASVRLLEGRGSSSTYTVAALRASLARDRGPWAGRVVAVRGVVEVTQTRFGCAGPGCRLIGLVDSLSDAPSMILWLGRRPPEPLRTALGHLPLLGALVPAPQTPRLGIPATYSVQILARPACVGQICFDATLLNAGTEDTIVPLAAPGATRIVAAPSR